MTGMVTQKKFKFEFEITVDMEEIGEEHLCDCESSQHLHALQQIQQVLVENPSVPDEQLMAKALGKLQEYSWAVT